MHIIYFTTEDNPAIDLDTGELVEIAASVGTPVSAFLMQDEMTDVIPDSVKVPPGEPYGSAAAMMVVSMTILLMGASGALFFNNNNIINNVTCTMIHNNPLCVLYNYQQNSYSNYVIINFSLASHVTSATNLLLSELKSCDCTCTSRLLQCHFFRLL
jgi:hypothetical protein